MRFFKHSLLTILLLSCNLNSGDDEEEFYYYEPLIDEAYEVTTDPDYLEEFNYQVQKDMVVVTEDSRGYQYTLEIPSYAMTPGYVSDFDGYIVPLTGIQNLPSGMEFKFGIEIEPSGMNFSKPVKITVDLPSDFDTEDLRGFYNQGAWGTAYLVPVKIKRTNGNLKAIFEVSHFSSYGAMKAPDEYFECPDQRSAQTCEDLKEVIGCILGHYEVGITEELTSEDKDIVNSILRSYMERQLRWLEEDPPDYFNLMEFENDLTEFLCWAGMTQEFNGNPQAIFGDLYDKAAYYIKMVFDDAAIDLENTCMDNRSDNECTHNIVWYTIQMYVQMLEIAQYLGIDQELSMPDIYDFCDDAINEVLFNFTMVDPLTMNEHYHTGGSETWFKSYQLELSDPDDIIQIMYMMDNALGETLELDFSEIKWIEDNSTYYGEEIFIIDDGMISLNKSHEDVSKALCNPYSNPDCLFSTFRKYYSINRNNCPIGYLQISWSNY